MAVLDTKLEGSDHPHAPANLRPGMGDWMGPRAGMEVEFLLCE